MKLFKNNITQRVLLAFVIYILTFPSFNLITSPGLDSSYTWGLNYLFANDYETLKQLVYPIGVLGFLKMPLAIGYNLIWAICFYSVIKIWFIYSLLNLSVPENKITRIIQLITVVLISMYSGFDITLIGLCGVLGIKFLSNQKSLLIFILTVIAYVSFNIKTSIGISAFSVLFMTVLLNFLKLKDWKQLIKTIGISLSALLLIGILLFQDIELLFTRFFQAFKVSSGYSSSLSLHPENNWWLLFGFILSIVLIPIIFKSKKIRVLFFLFLPSFFMMWKHAMVREDASHNGILLYFTFIFWGIAILYSNKNLIKIGIWGAASMTLFFFNLKNIDGFNGISFNLNGIKNLNQNLHYESYVTKNNQASEIELEKLTLSSEIKTIIGDNTIDFYPWEHAYAKANKLNWHPRKTIELGGSSSQWVSEISASHFSCKDSPEFILFHFQSDRYEGELSSFDGRHLLNDEPLFIKNLIANYSKEYTNDKFSLFRKNPDPDSIIKTLFPEETIQFNKWVSVPKEETSFTTCKVNVQHSISQKALTFLYKDDKYLIDYKLNDGRVFTYRFLPNTAVDGLWCNPLITELQSKKIEGEVAKIRFRKLYYGDSEIKIQFVKNEIITTRNMISIPFNKSAANNRKTVLIRKN
ncbi:MAG: hypothetical protein ACPGVD_11920, partial [Flavobacteriales bacterium]